MSSKPVWSEQQISDQTRSQSETLSQKQHQQQNPNEDCHLHRNDKYSNAGEEESQIALEPTTLKQLIKVD